MTSDVTGQKLRINICLVFDPKRDMFSTPFEAQGTTQKTGGNTVRARG